MNEEPHSLGRYSLNTQVEQSGVSLKFSFSADPNGSSVLAYIENEYWMIPLTADVPAIKVSLPKLYRLNLEQSDDKLMDNKRGDGS